VGDQCYGQCRADGGVREKYEGERHTQREGEQSLSQ
jgi:hypothetical protein